MFMVGEIVRPSGKGCTATWEGMVGTVTRVGEGLLFVQWHNVAVEDELAFEEVVSTHTRSTRRCRITPACSTGGGTSDGRFLATIAQEVVEFGPVSGSIHGIDEHVPLADIAPLSAVYEQTIAALLMT